MFKHYRLVFLLTAAALAFTIVPSCKADKTQNGKLSIFVSIPPQKYFVDRVGGPFVETRVLISPGQSPHTFTPSPRQIAELSQAKLFFITGVPFETAVVKKVAEQNQNLDIVDMASGIPHEPMGPDPHDPFHVEGELDPHVWMNPKNAVLMARNTAETLAGKDPAHKKEYMQNRDALIADLEALDRKIATLLAPYKGERFYVYHPAFGYFGQAYGLEQVAVETGGKEPTAKRLNSLIKQARGERVRIIFVQPQFSQKSADRVAAEINGTVTPIDALAEDYIANMEHIADALKQGLE